MTLSEKNSSVLCWWPLPSDKVLLQWGAHPEDARAGWVPTAGCHTPFSLGTHRQTNTALPSLLGCMIQEQRTREYHRLTTCFGMAKSKTCSKNKPKPEMYCKEFRLDVSEWASMQFCVSCYLWLQLCALSSSPFMRLLSFPQGFSAIQSRAARQEWALLNLFDTSGLFTYVSFCFPKNCWTLLSWSSLEISQCTCLLSIKLWRFLSKSILPRDTIL